MFTGQNLVFSPRASNAGEFFRNAKRHVGSDHGATNAPDAGGRALGSGTAPTTAVEVVHALLHQKMGTEQLGHSDHTDLEARTKRNQVVYGGFHKWGYPKIDGF